MQNLADFLNHGALPFIGRVRETSGIVDFWRGTFHASELRSMLLIGEAGMGKSRLLDRAIEQIIESGGCVVHVKLYPESTASLASLVARALWSRDAGRNVLSESPEPRIPSVGAAMRRLARLRPTFFIIEDIHLLVGDGVTELDRLLGLVADESISLLALARPVDIESRAILERFLVDSVVLSGLSPGECGQIWEEISGSDASAEMKSALYDATAGNPLALRSALRGAVRSANVPIDDMLVQWRSPEGVRTLARTLRQRVDLLADGMVAHLSEEERGSAEHLAQLGEVFSREGASIMLRGDEQMLDTLLFKGVIATASAPPDPLPGVQSEYPPLGFTHTLLHRQLNNPASLDGERLIHVIADAPLYSVVPFRLLSDTTWPVPSLENDVIIRAFDRTIRLQIGIGRGAQWKSREKTWKTALRLVSSRLGTWNQEEWEAMLVRLLHHKLSLVRGEAPEVRRTWLDYLERVTEEGVSDELMKGRLLAMFHRDALESPGNPDVTRSLWEKGESIVDARPHLKNSFAYAEYVIAACFGAYGNGDMEMMRRIETRANELIASPEFPDRIRGAFAPRIRPPLLKLYESPEDLDERLAQIAEFERTIQKSDISVWIFCVDLLADAAIVDMLVRLCDRIMGSMREQGLVSLIADTIARRGCVLIGIGSFLSDIQREFDQALTALPEWRRLRDQGTLALPLIDAALLVGAVDQARMMIERYGIEINALSPEGRLSLDLHTGDVQESLSASRAAGLNDGDFKPLVDILLGVDASNIDRSCKNLLSLPILRVTDVLRTCVAVALTDMVVDRDLLDRKRASALISQALDRALSWLASSERGLFAFMRTVLEMGENDLAGKRREEWEKTIERLQGSTERGDPAVNNERMKLSMIGSIVLRMTDGREQKFQGARARTVLAMMVINQTLRNPLSLSEFSCLAAGVDEADEEKARDILKTTIHRIRESIGHQAILTDGQTPQLNPAVVEVDVLEVRRLLERARVSIRRASPMQAKAALLSAFALSRGDVPYPSLYDPFIEAARDDFDNDMRTSTMEVVTALMDEGGIDDAIVVLDTATEVIHGDEELDELLREALLRYGRRADAERVGMQIGVAREEEPRQS